MSEEAGRVRVGRRLRSDLDLSDLKEPFLEDESLVRPAAYWRRVAVYHAVHHQRSAARNSKLFHGFTVGAMTISAMAAVLPWDTAARVCGGVVTVLIGVMRTLELGNRWRWHLKMDADYTVISQKLRNLGLGSDPRRALIGLVQELAELEGKEDQIPGVGTPESVPAGVRSTTVVPGKTL